MNRRTLTYTLNIGLLFLAMALSGCDRHAEDDHEGLTRVEVLDRTQTPPPVIATWVRNQGWDRETLLTLESGITEGNFGRASIGVQMYDGQGDLIPMSTVSRDPVTDDRVCSELSVRYGVALQATENIIYHPQGDQGAVTVQGEQRNTFHCDHLHLYPRQAGTTQIQFFLWHVDHSDDATSPIQVVVQ